MRLKEEILIKYLDAWENNEYPDNTINEVMEFAIYHNDGEYQSINDIPYKLEYLEACIEIRNLHTKIKTMKERLDFYS